MSALIHLAVMLLACAVLPTGHAAYNKFLQEGLAMVEERDAYYIKAVMANDRNQMLELYTDNVVVLPEGFPPVVGKDSFAPHTTWVDKVGKIDSEIHYLDYLNTNALEWSILEWKMSTVYDTAGSVLFKGKTLIIWHWDEATQNFKIALEMYNTNGKA